MQHPAGRVGRRRVERQHLHVGVELAVGVGIGDVGGEVDGRRDRLDLDVDAGLLGGLLDDRLRLLAGRVDGGLVDELQLLAVLRPDAVAALLPAGILEQLLGLGDVEFELGVLGGDVVGPVQDVRRRPARAAVDELLDRIRDR